MAVAQIVALAGGLGLLVLGAEGLVRGSAASARRLGVGPLAIGLTVVAFGTSGPELVVSVRAALAGNGDIAAGNVVGSNIANVLLILGLAAMVRPLAINAKVVRLDIPIMIVVSFAVLPLVLDGVVNRVEGFALVAGIAVYTWLSIVLAGRERDAGVIDEFERGLPPWPRTLAGAIALVPAGLVALVFGADLFVRGAVGAAAALGLSEAVIGITIVAVGTSMPELVTSIVAAAKGENDIAVGNIVGSNIFNLLGIVGVSAVVRPLRMAGIDVIDWLVMLAAALLLLPLARSGARLSRWEAVLLLVGYAAYVLFRTGILQADF